MNFTMADAPESQRFNRGFLIFGEAYSTLDLSNFDFLIFFFRHGILTPLSLSLKYLFNRNTPFPGNRFGIH